MISDALEGPVPDEECVKSCFLYSILVSGYTLELICEAVRVFLRCLSWRVRKKYKAMGAIRATTTIGTTIAGIRLSGMPWTGGEDVSAGGDVWTGEADEVIVEEEEGVGGGVAEINSAMAVETEFPSGCREVTGGGGMKLGNEV